MANYATPGVYVEEVSTGPRPLAQAGTTTPAFIGKAPDATALVDEPTQVTSWSDFVSKYCSEKSKGTDLGRAVFGFFANGGGMCYVLNIGASGTVAGDPVKGTGISAFESFEDVSMVAAPGATTIDDYNALLDHASKMADRFAILDGPKTFKGTKQMTEVMTEGAGAGAGAKKGLRPKQVDDGCGAIYVPWLICRDPFGEGTVEVPPSGVMAGLYALTDTMRGVHKAPANLQPRACKGLTQRITHEQQGELNSAGINCIRFFGRDGIRVWGARTLAAEASEWRYINVRRLFYMVEESIAVGTRWCVFEPNDRILWASIIRDISSFLRQLWVDGALVGTAEGEAFYVKCDAELNTPDVINAGRLVIEVGIAPSRPAEFVIFRIGQYAGGTDVESAYFKE